MSLMWGRVVKSRSILGPWCTWLSCLVWAVAMCGMLSFARSIKNNGTSCICVHRIVRPDGVTRRNPL